jgi:steroid delta-isomerase-like uncharacterized protein
MLRTDSAALIDRLTEAWNAHDAERVAACYAPDAVSRDVTLTDSLHGRTAIRNGAQTYMRAFPDIRVEVKRLFGDGELICEEWRATGTHRGDLFGLPATGRTAEVIGCNVMQLGSDGLIQSETTYSDAAGLYRQLESLPQLARARY